METPIVLANTVSAGIAEAITGMSPAQQRNLRRRGHMPALSGEGRNAKLDGETLAYMRLLQTFSGRGIDPADSTDHLRDLASHVLYFSAAYGDPNEPIYADQTGTAITAKRAGRLIFAHTRHAPMEAVERLTFRRFFVWGSRHATTMTDDLNETFGIMRPRDEPETVADLSERLKIVSAQREGPALILDLSAIGIDLAERARHWRPLYVLHPPDADEFLT